MNKIVTKLLFLIILSSLLFPQDNQYPVDLEVVSQIREEGLNNSDLPNTLSYMTDVLGARLTNSDDMYRAQEWAVEKMQAIGLENIEIEPFMDYGVSWDNTYLAYTYWNQTINQCLGIQLHIRLEQWEKNN